jgi:hypothetical protein
MFPAFETEIASSTGCGALFSEIVLDHQAATFVLIVGVSENRIDMFPQFVTFRSDAYVFFGQTLFGQHQYGAAITWNIADDV